LLTKEDFFLKKTHALVFATSAQQRPRGADCSWTWGSRQSGDCCRKYIKNTDINKYSDKSCRNFSSAKRSHFWHAWQFGSVAHPVLLIKLLAQCCIAVLFTSGATLLYLTLRDVI